MSAGKGFNCITPNKKSRPSLQDIDMNENLNVDNKESHIRTLDDVKHIEDI